MQKIWNKSVKEKNWRKGNNRKITMTLTTGRQQQQKKGKTYRQNGQEQLIWLPLCTNADLWMAEIEQM